MPHEDVDVSCRHVRIGPNHRVIAHLDRRRRRVARLVDAGQHADIAPRAAIVGVPFLAGDDERLGHASHAGMRFVFHVDRGGGKGGNVVPILDLAHEVGEPGPHLLAVEVAQQRCMVQTDPTALALLDVRLEGGLRLGLPTVGDKVQLQHQAVLGEVLGRDGGRVGDVVDLEAVFLAAFLQPGSRGFGESDVVAAGFRQGEHLELGLGRRERRCDRGSHAGHDPRQESQSFHKTAPTGRTEHGFHRESRNGDVP